MAVRWPMTPAALPYALFGWRRSSLRSMSPLSIASAYERRFVIGGRGLTAEAEKCAPAIPWRAVRTHFATGWQGGRWARRGPSSRIRCRIRRPSRLVPVARLPRLYGRGRSFHRDGMGGGHARPRRPWTTRVSPRGPHRTRPVDLLARMAAAMPRADRYRTAFRADQVEEGASARSRRFRIGCSAGKRFSLTARWGRPRQPSALTGCAPAAKQEEPAADSLPVTGGDPLDFSWSSLKRQPLSAEGLREGRPGRAHRHRFRRR